jgi:hypothetical protein
MNWVLEIWKSHRKALARRQTGRSRVQFPVAIETLELRLVLSGTSLNPTMYASPILQGAGTGAPFATSGPTGYSPAQIRHAYGFDDISFVGGTIPGSGLGMTIAIVDAYDDPKIANDLHQFNLAFGLPDCGFTKVNQTGGTNYPQADAGWISEIALDVEWAHAIAPLANILLVEANNSSFDNLLTAVDYARNAPGVVAVSMSWGGGEFQGETAYDSHFTTPAGHIGVTFLVSSGDTGAPTSYPSASPNVISVGGTKLNLDAQGNISSESAWSGSGGGISAYESKPDYQKSTVMPISTTHRTNPDVAYDSDPNTGFPVYDTYNNTAAHPWEQFGGTSDAAPQWAALIAIADQGRALNGLASLDGASQTLPLIYSVNAADFRDITSGASQGKPQYSAVAGFDFATGRGSPIANLVIRDLAGVSSDPGDPVVTSFSISTVSSTVAGTSFSTTISAVNSSHNVVPGYLGTVHFTSQDGAAGLPADYTFTADDNGVHTFDNLVLKTAGSQLVTITDSVTQSILGYTSIIVNAAAADHLSFAQQPLDATMTLLFTPAVTVQVLDLYGNVVTNDNGRNVSLQLGANPGTGVLNGTTPATVTNGVATFSNLSISQAGIGYTLVASATGLGTVTSATFNVASGRIIENFEGANLSAYRTLGGAIPTATLSASAAHDGVKGLLDAAGNDWIYRNDVPATVKQGDTISVWMRFDGSKTGMANFGFGSGPNGTMSIAASGQTNQVLLQINAVNGAANIGTASQTWLPNHWYRLEVGWSTSGAITGKVFDSNGTSLLSTVNGTSTLFRTGGIGFRSVNSLVDWDTVQVVSGSAVGGGGGSGGGTVPPKGPPPIHVLLAAPGMDSTSAVSAGLTVATLPTLAISNTAKSGSNAANSDVNATISIMGRTDLSLTPLGKSRVTKSEAPVDNAVTQSFDLHDELFKSLPSIS